MHSTIYANTNDECNFVSNTCNKSKKRRIDEYNNVFTNLSDHIINESEQNSKSENNNDTQKFRNENISKDKINNFVSILESQFRTNLDKNKKELKNQNNNKTSGSKKRQRRVN